MIMRGGKESLVLVLRGCEVFFEEGSKFLGGGGGVPVGVAAGWGRYLW